MRGTLNTAHQRPMRPFWRTSRLVLSIAKSHANLRHLIFCLLFARTVPFFVAETRDQREQIVQTNFQHGAQRSCGSVTMLTLSLKVTIFTRSRKAESRREVPLLSMDRQIYFLGSLIFARVFRATIRRRDPRRSLAGGAARTNREISQFPQR